MFLQLKCWSWWTTSDDPSAEAGRVVDPLDENLIIRLTSTALIRDT
jgi:hypothetical protein